ncbi:MAG: N-acetylmuramoyl-L-alanine amidase [Desulfovibrio sp.]|jgi:N-acetylmuramoyl-L-alanine amidase|nr:N-acetylmuramoyl-L-alanine amidase [Desulfovibrio sp.]
MRAVSLFLLVTALTFCIAAAPAQAAQTTSSRQTGQSAKKTPERKKTAQGTQKSSGKARTTRKQNAQKPRQGQKAQSPANADALLEQLGLTVKTIMIDAGHGGRDPGAQAFGITEKDFTLALAARLGETLRKRGFRIIYTRTDNRYVGLQERPDAANAKKADLFISVHANSNPNPAHKGLETYYLAETKSHDALTVAARENGVAPQEISDLQFILTDLLLSSKVKESRHLAECVQSGMLAALRKAGTSTPDNGVRGAPFRVLMGARMPAILAEFGYISNKEEAANLKKDGYLQKLCDGLANGIVKYKQDLAAQTPG